MRLCLFAFAALLMVSAHALGTRAQAQEARQPGAGAAKEDAADMAEQLVRQVQQWYETLGAQGQLPRVFTGITPEPRQLVIELDGGQQRATFGVEPVQRAGGGG